MIIKIFKTGTGKGSGPVDYLLGKDRNREDARLDRGDPENIIDLIDSLDYSKKYTSGVLSFSEPDLSESTKKTIMDDFEKYLMAGLDENNYSILWVQHKDKQRLELNFVIPNVELKSGRRLQPYFDRADRTRVNAFKNCVNIKYNLSDPNDPARKQLLVKNSSCPSEVNEIKEKITTGIANLANSGKVKNRDDVIDLLENAGFEITRKTNKSISIKNPNGNRNIRLKGEFYEQNFRFSKNIRGDIDSRSKEYRESREQRYQESRKTLIECFESKREYNKSRYERQNVENNQRINSPINHIDNFSIYSSFGTYSDKYLSNRHNCKKLSDITVTETVNRLIISDEIRRQELPDFEKWREHFEKENLFYRKQKWQKENDNWLSNQLDNNDDIKVNKNDRTRKDAFRFIEKCNESTKQINETSIRIEQSSRDLKRGIEKLKHQNANIGELGDRTKSKIDLVNKRIDEKKQQQINERQQNFNKRGLSR